MTPKDAVLAYAEAWRTGDKDAFLALFADDASIEDPVGSPPHVGKPALAALWDRVRMNGQARFEPEVHRAVACGGEAMLVFTMVTRFGPAGGMAVDLVDVFTFADDGRVQTMRAYWDPACMRRVTS